MTHHLLVSQMVYPENSSKENIKYWKEQIKEYHSNYAEIEKEYTFIEDNFVYYFLVARLFDFPLEMVEREVDEDWYSLLSETMKEKVKIMKEGKEEE